MFFPWFSLIFFAPFPFTQVFSVFYVIKLRIDNLTFISNESIASEYELTTSEINLEGCFNTLYVVIHITILTFLFHS